MINLSHENLILKFYNMKLMIYALCKASSIFYVELSTAIDGSNVPSV